MKKDGLVSSTYQLKFNSKTLIEKSLGHMGKIAANEWYTNNSEHFSDNFYA